MKRFLGVMALLCTVTGAAPAQTTDRSAPPSRIAGNWQVSYEDLALGEIDGTAKISEDGKKATVTLNAAPGGTPFTLISESVSEQGDDYTFVLVGEGPASSSLTPDATVEQQGVRAVQDAVATVFANSGIKSAVPLLATVPPMGPRPIPPIPGLGPKPGWAYGQPTQPPDVHLAVPGDGPSIGIEIADYKATVPFKAMHSVETNRVTLTLHYSPTSDSAGYAGPAGDLLSGTWKYFADPITWRDGAGKGRVGYFRRDAQNTNLTTESAAEVWFRPNPPAQIQFIALGAFGEIRIKHLFPGVPTFVEAIFDAPQDEETVLIDVDVGGTKTAMPAHRDPENGRRFTTDPFLPALDTRSEPPPSSRPAPAPDAADPQKEL